MLPDRYKADLETLKNELDPEGKVFKVLDQEQPTLAKFHRKASGLARDYDGIMNVLSCLRGGP